jgi:hypothetical protein
MIYPKHYIFTFDMATELEKSAYWVSRAQDCKFVWFFHKKPHKTNLEAGKFRIFFQCKLYEALKQSLT